MKAHQAQADRAVAHIRVTGFLDGVVVDVDHVVQHAHGRLDRFLELVVVQHLGAVRAVFQVPHQIDRAEVANSGFGVAGIERDFCAEV